jgi:hypothetical protein
VEEKNLEPECPLSLKGSGAYLSNNRPFVLHMEGPSTGTDFLDLRAYYGPFLYPGSSTDPQVDVWQTELRSRSGIIFVDQEL